MPLPTPTLRTARLWLRDVDDAGSGDLRVPQHAAVLRYWGTPAWRGASAPNAFIAPSRQMAEDGTGARLAVDQVSDESFPRLVQPDQVEPGPPQRVVGLLLRRRSLGQGYATGAARVLLQWALDTLDLNRVQAETDKATRPLPASWRSSTSSVKGRGGRTAS